MGNSEKLCRIGKIDSLCGFIEIDFSNLEFVTPETLCCKNTFLNTSYGVYC